MAVPAVFRGYEVIAGFTAGLYAVMAGIAARVTDLTVIELGGYPGVGAVAEITLLGAGNVVRRFPLGYQVVVTTAADPLHLRMIHPRRHECRR